MLNTAALHAVSESLQTNVNLERLVLENCGLSAEDMAVIIVLLREKVGVLQQLSLSGNPMGDEGVQTLLVPELLRIEAVFIGDVGLTHRGVAVFGHVLLESRSHGGRRPAASTDSRPPLGSERPLRRTSSGRVRTCRTDRAPSFASEDA